MKIRSAFLLAGLIALAGCGDDPTSPNTTGVSGSLSFSYTGAGAANATVWSAAGAIPTSVSSSLGTAAWAGGSYSTASNYTVIGAAIPRTSTTWDITSINVTRTTVGTNQISANCDDLESTTCTGVIVVYNMNPNGDTFSQMCFLETGSVTISAISSSNITGTFSGTGSCFTSVGALSAFTVTNGTFNVGVTNQLL